MNRSKKAAMRRVHTATRARSTAGAGFQESPEDRVQRLYAGDGGPLVQWLIDEAAVRRMDLKDMAREVGVTYGYIHQLRNGQRKTATISGDFARACADFLGVPPVTVFLLAGAITMRDFATRAATDDEVVQRAVRRMQADPHCRATLPVDFEELGSEGKKALALLYADVSGQDVFGVRQLPEILRWLQRAAEIHDENAFAAAAGHRDTAARVA